MDYQNGFKAKTIYEVAYLKMRGIPIIKEIQYERKRIFFFADDQRQSTNAIKEFYASGFLEYAQEVQDVRDYIFKKLNESNKSESNN